MTRATLLLIALATALLATAPSAQASTDTYTVPACNFAPEGVNHSWTWSSSDPSSPDHYAKHETCPDLIGGNGGRTDQEGGLSTTDALGLSNGAAPGTSAGWTFTAPTGTTITGITYERYIGHELDSSNYWAPALRADGTILPGESCLDTPENQWSCYVGAPPNEGTEAKIITGLSAQELTLGINCEAHTEEQCITGAKLHKAWAAMYGATVTISDATPPTHTTPTGTLWEPSPYKKGTQTATVNAEDIGGGVKTIELAVDGHTTQTYPAACDYTLPKPCPATTGAQTLTLNSTELHDGPHTISLIATDAAGNQSTPTTEQIDIENTPPPPPTNLTATPTEPGSTTLTANWNDPTGLSSPITSATYQLCPVNPPGACSAATPAAATGPLTLTVPGPGAWRLLVWLTNAAGNTNPTNAAQTELTVPAPGPPQAPQTTSVITSGRAVPGSSTQFPPLPQPRLPARLSLRLAAYIQRGHVIVRAWGQPNSKVRITLLRSIHGRGLVIASRTATLQHGRVTLTFNLTRKARQTPLKVEAQLLPHRALVREIVQRR